MNFQPIGLTNLGNTCFLNTVLQVIRLCPPIRDCIKASLREGTKKAALHRGIEAFLGDVDAATSGQQVSTRSAYTGLVETLRETGEDWYVPRHQADAAECLQYILDSLHDAVYRRVRITIHGTPRSDEQEEHKKALTSWATFFTKEYSPIVESFYGQTQTVVECSACNSRSYRYEPWMMLKVPIPGGDTVGSAVPTFVDCMNAAHQPEELEGYDCETCKSKQRAVLTTRISRLPSLLILCFKRFTNTGRKIRGQVDWNTESMELAPWMAFRQCPFSEKRITTYRTFAVIEHLGSLHGGHYRMFVRGSGSGNGSGSGSGNGSGSSSGGWWEFDDECVRSGISSVVSPDSYIIVAQAT